jgi:6-phosphogluconate dehydrogenase (decarboxylating)
VTLAMIGLGRMGGSMTERRVDDGHEGVADAPDAAAVAAAEKRGAIGAHSVAEVIAALRKQFGGHVVKPAHET